MASQPARLIFQPTPEQEKGQHGVVATMKVKMLADGTEANINAHDFDPEKHEKVDVEKKEEKKKK
jgi:hypothetical protein